MRCLAICQDELIIRTLDQLLLPSLHVEFLVQNRALARRLHEAGTHAIVGDPRRVDSYLKADISPSTCVIVEDNGKRSLKPILEAIHDAGGTLIYVLGVGENASTKRTDELRAQFPEVAHLGMANLLRGSLLNELGRSITRTKVQ